MGKIALFGLGLMASLSTSAYEVSLGTFVVNPGQRVAVPVCIDSIRGASHVGVRVTYDPQVLVLMKVEKGTLTGRLSDDFVAIGDEKGGVVTVSAFGSGNVTADVGGSLASLLFVAREGTQGHYSDVTVAKVKIGEETGVKDLTVANPVRVRSGMVRVMGTGAEVRRLEAPQTVCADGAYGSLNLMPGDAIQASDSQTGIAVAGAVEAAAPIVVRAPPNGWANGRYTLLSTITKGLSFALEGTTAGVVSETANGMTTYFATIALPDEIPVVCESESLTPGSMNQIKANARLLFEGKTDSESLALKAMFEKAKRMSVEGPSGSIGVIADMGLSPCFAGVDETGTLKLTYAMPKLEITSFDPQTGAVRFKVTPGEGNRIVSEIATGYLHVYGSGNLGEKMRYISSVGFDLTPYLKPDTKGEGVLNVILGTHSFLKIKVEAVQKSEGETE